MIDPIKLCCMRPMSEHSGVLCPDGTVMCCLCFGRYDLTELHRDADGALHDVCKPCAVMDAL